MENETAHEREHYQKLLEINEELHRTKHDLKNHLLYVQEIIDSNDIVKAEKYVKDLNEEIIKLTNNK